MCQLRARQSKRTSNSFTQQLLKHSKPYTLNPDPVLAFEVHLYEALSKSCGCQRLADVVCVVSFQFPSIGDPNIDPIL